MSIVRGSTIWRNGYIEVELAKTTLETILLFIFNLKNKKQIKIIYLEFVIRETKKNLRKMFGEGLK